MNIESKGDIEYINNLILKYATLCYQDKGLKIENVNYDSASLECSYTFKNEDGRPVCIRTSLTQIEKICKENESK